MRNEPSLSLCIRSETLVAARMHWPTRERQSLHRLCQPTVKLVSIPTLRRFPRSWRELYVFDRQLEPGTVAIWHVPAVSCIRPRLE